MVTNMAQRECESWPKAPKCQSPGERASVKMLTQAKLALSLLAFFSASLGQVKKKKLLLVGLLPLWLTFFSYFLRIAQVSAHAMLKPWPIPPPLPPLQLT